MFYVLKKRLCHFWCSLFLNQWSDQSWPSFERARCLHNYQMHICPSFHFGGTHVWSSYSAGHYVLFKSVPWTADINTIAVLPQIKHTWERKYLHHNHNRIKQIVKKLEVIHFKLLLENSLLASKDSNSVLVNLNWCSARIKSVTSTYIHMFWLLLFLNSWDLGRGFLRLLRIPKWELQHSGS